MNIYLFTVRNSITDRFFFLYIEIIERNNILYKWKFIFCVYNLVFSFFYPYRSKNQLSPYEKKTAICLSKFELI